MADFSRLLAYFRRPDVEALYFRSEQAIILRLKGELSHLTPRPLSTGDIQHIIKSGPLAPMLSRLGLEPVRAQIQGPDGSPLQISACIDAGALAMSIRRPGCPEHLHGSPPAQNGAETPARQRSSGPQDPGNPGALGASAGQGSMPRRSGRRRTRSISELNGRDEIGHKTPRNSAGNAAGNATGKAAGGTPGGAAPRARARTPLRPRSRTGDPGSSSRRSRKHGRSATPATAVASGRSSRHPSAPGPNTTSPPSEAAAPAFSLADQAPGSIPPQLREILSRARSQGASDLHLSSGRPILLRKVGELVPEDIALSHEQAQALLSPLLGTRDRQQFQDKGYADFAIECRNAGRFRVNLCRHKQGIKGCFRVLPQKPPSLEALGLPPELAAVLDHHQGLAVIAGPNGQGKSTTLAALVNILNQKRALHIISVEDPIEIVHPIAKAIVSQRQVGRDTKNYYSALKAALREDPDVIVIGELRDRETVEMALSAAETGHLVIASMNTPSGAKTIGRLIDLFPPDDQAQVRATLAGALKIVTAQRLVPNADGRRRVAAVELLTGGVPLWSLIRENKLYQLPGLMQRGRRFGMIRLKDSLDNLLERGAIDQATHTRFAATEAGFDLGSSDEGSAFAEDPAANTGAPTGDSAAPAAETPHQGGAVGKMVNFFKKATG